MTDALIYGIDISSWQGDIDLAALAPGFVILRGGAGRNVDQQAVRNMDLCDRLGIPYGVYWYSYALSVEDARAEAERCLELIRGRNVRVGVWCDMEDADNYKAKNGALRRELTSAMAYAFAETVEDAGYYAGIYASLSWIKDGWLAGCERFDKWVACWSNNNGQLGTDTSAYGSLHQYAGDVAHDGYRLDLDVCYVPLSRFDRSAEKPPDEQQPEQEDKPETAGLSALPHLARGSKGVPVVALQGVLIARGYSCGPDGADGDYGYNTRNAVCRFQTDKRLPVTGGIGDKDWIALITKI